MRGLISLFWKAFRYLRPLITFLFVAVLLAMPLVPSTYLEYRIGVLIGLFITFIFLFFDIQRQITEAVSDLNSRLEDINSQIGKAGSDLNSRLEHVDKRFDEIGYPLHKAAFSRNLGRPEVQVAEKLYEASKRAAGQLDKPKSTFMDHKAYTAELLKKIDLMMKDRPGRIYAACGQKEWDDELINQWFDKNYEALKSNIPITRIFLEEEEWAKVPKKQAAADAQMKLQANRGIDVRFARQTDLNKIDLLRGFPEGFGFVVFDYDNEMPEVIVHNKPNDDRSVLFDDPMIVGQFISTFKLLNTGDCSSLIKPDAVPLDESVVLVKTVRQQSEEMARQVKQLLGNRLSDMQLKLVNQRFEAELKNINQLLEGSVSISAVDKFEYLTEIFTQVLELLTKHHTYKTVSTVQFWSSNTEVRGGKAGVRSGKAEVLRKCLKATSGALARGAEIERVIFVDEKQLNEPSATDYRSRLQAVITLFEDFRKENAKHGVKFFVGDSKRGDFAGFLKYAPRAMIAEPAKNDNRLGLITKHGDEGPGTIAPRLKLQFYKEGESDNYSNDFDNNFGDVLSKSKDLSWMQNELTKRSKLTKSK